MTRPATTSRRRQTPPSPSGSAIFVMPLYLYGPASLTQLASAKGLKRPWTFTVLAGTLLAALCLPASALGTVGSAMAAIHATPAAFPAGTRLERLAAGGEPVDALLAQTALPAEKFQRVAAPIAPASRANSSALGVDQVRNLPASAALAMPAQPPASPSQLQTPRQPAIRSPASQSLQSERVQPGAAPKAAKPLSTSASCENAGSGAECLLPGQASADWRKNTGVEIDPVTGAMLIPGVTLNPPPRP